MKTKELKSLLRRELETKELIFCSNLEVICGDVGPSEVVQRGDKTVQVDQHVVVQPSKRSFMICVKIFQK